MNHYGTQAQNHWRTHLPQSYSQITDPTTFFTELGERVETQIVDLQIQLAGEDVRGEDFLAKVGRLNNAKMRAEEIVLREQVLITPEKTTYYDSELDRDVEETEQERAEAEREKGWIPLTEDPTHPYWRRKRAMELNPDYDEEEIRRFVP